MTDPALRLMVENPRMATSRIRWSIRRCAIARRPPFVDQLLGEIGMTSGSIHRTETLQDLSKVVYTDPASASDQPERKPKTPKN